MFKVILAEEKDKPNPIVYTVYGVIEDNNTVYFLIFEEGSKGDNGQWHLYFASRYMPVEALTVQETLYWFPERTRV